MIPLEYKMKHKRERGKKSLFSVALLLPLTKRDSIAILGEVPGERFLGASLSLIGEGEDDVKRKVLFGTVFSSLVQKISS